MNDDFLVYWVQEEYIPNGTEQDDGEWSGEVIEETTFAIMSGDKQLDIEEICTVDSIIRPTKLPIDGWYKSDYPYVVIGSDTAIIAVENDEDADHGYDTCRIAFLNKPEKTFNIVIDDLTLTALSLVGIGQDVINDYPASYLPRNNNSFFKNGELHAWFGISVGNYPNPNSVDYSVEYYFSINLETGLISHIDGAENLDGKEVQIITSNLVSYTAEGIGGWSVPCLFPRSEVEPVAIIQTARNGDILFVSDDESKVLTLAHDPEIETYSYNIHDLLADDGNHSVEVHFFQGWPVPLFLFIDIDAGIIAFELEQHGLLEIRYYNFQQQLISIYTSESGSGSYDEYRSEFLRYTNAKSSAVFIFEAETKEIDDPIWGPYQVYVSAVIFPDGSNVIVEDKHPFLIEEGVYTRPAGNGCLGMWPGNEKIFWTAFLNTQETI